MTRRVFPDEGSRLVYDVASGGLLPTSTIVDLYLDAAATQPATDLLDADGGALTAGFVRLDAYRRLPLFSGPDGVDTLYAVVAGGPVTPIYARTDDRLDSLESRVTTVESTAGAAIPAVQKAAANGVASLDGAGTVPDAQIPASIARDSEVAAAVAALVAGAPGALDTLNELATALGDDASFSATVTTALAGKATPADIAAAIATQHTADIGAFAPVTNAPFYDGFGGDVRKYRIDVSKAVFTNLGQVPFATGITGDDIVELSVFHAPNGYKGHKLWLGWAPYPNGDATFENPSVAVSDDDGATWATPAGMSNPLYPTGVGGQGTNSDNTIYLGPDGTLFMFWYQNGAGNTSALIRMAYCTDGVTWTGPITVYSTSALTTEFPISPAVFWDQRLGKWVMYCCDQSATGSSPYFITRYTADPAVGRPGPGTFVKGTNPTYPTWPNPTNSPFHINAKRVGDTHVLMVNDAINQGAGTGGLYLMASVDSGATFTLSPSLFPVSVYRSDFIPTIGPGGLGFDVYFGRSLAGAWTIWKGRIDLLTVPPRYGQDTTDILNSYHARLLSAKSALAPWDFCDLGKTAPENGPAWTVTGSGFTYANGFVGPSVSGGLQILTQTAASADGVAEVFMKRSSTADVPWVVFRYADTNNYLRAGFNGAPFQLAKVVAGVATSLGINYTVPGDKSLTEGVVVKVVYSGSSVKVYLDGVLTHDLTVTDGQTNVKWGVRGSTTACLFKNIVHRALYNGA